MTSEKIYHHCLVCVCASENKTVGKLEAGKLPSLPGAVPGPVTNPLLPDSIGETASCRSGGTDCF